MNGNPVADEPDFVLEFTIGREDVGNVISWQQWHGRRTRLARVLAVTGSLIGIALIIVWITGAGHYDLAWPIVLALFPLIWTVAAHLQAMIAVRNNPVLKEPVRLEVSGGGIDVRRRSTSGHTSWPGFSALNETRRAYLLRYTGTKSYQIIPKRALGAEAAHFRGYIDEHLSSAGRARAGRAARDDRL